MEIKKVHYLISFCNQVLAELIKDRQWDFWTPDVDGQIKHELEEIMDPYERKMFQIKIKFFLKALIGMAQAILDEME